MKPENMSRNLQFTRRRLKLSQREFVDSFITDDQGKALCSVPKLSNLENKGGNNLGTVCGIIAERLGLAFEDFSLEQNEFVERLEECLDKDEISKDSLLDDIVQEADSHNELEAFIRTLSNYLTDQLLKEELLPGDKIPSERALSSKFHISRSIARETLKVLNVLGMIDIIPGKGTFISNGSSDFFITPLSWAIYLTDKDASDIFFVRRSLEESVIAVSCQKADQADLSRLESILVKAGQALEKEDYDAFAEQDIEFHMTIVAASHNNVALNLLGVLRKLSTSISQKGMITAEQLRVIQEEHTGLYEAVKDRNPMLARVRLIEHFDHTHERYVENLKNMDIK